MDLRLELDENIPLRVGPALRKLGCDVATAESEGLAGARDPQLLAACIAEQRVLVTLDLDFADMRAYPPGSHPGIWVLRPPEQSVGTVLALALSGIRLAPLEPVSGRLWVIDSHRVRIRERPP